MDGPRQPLSFRLSRYLSLLGALVLAFTFVVHDQLGEHAKDLVSEVQSAQLQFDLRHRLKLLGDRISSIRCTTGPKGGDEDWGSSETPKTNAEAERELDLDQPLINSARDYYSNLQPLIEVVRGQPQVGQPATDVKDSDASLRKAEKDFFPFSLKEGSKPDNTPLASIQAAAIAVIREQAVVLPDRVDKLSSVVLKAADGEMKRRKRATDWFTLATWILYPFGSLLVIAGKFFEPSEKPKDADVLP